jgi:hypothetical protein
MKGNAEFVDVAMKLGSSGDKRRALAAVADRAP